jgi:hypothetical protein
MRKQKLTRALKTTIAKEIKGLLKRGVIFSDEGLAEKHLVTVDQIRKIREFGRL